MHEKSLKEIIVERILSEGPISFRDYMEMCLYHPLGYYCRDQEAIGINGDYYTSVAFTSLFGRLLGKQIEEMWTLLGERPFTIVEFGGGSGQLCNDIMTYLSKNLKLFKNLHYVIVEKKAPKADFKFSYKVTCIQDASTLQNIEGCVLSNELLDNFPVHRVKMQEELMEIFIDHEDNLKEIVREATPDLKAYFKRFDMVLPRDYTTEVNLDVKDWVTQVAKFLKSGFILTLDYGSLANQLYDDSHYEGTLTCFHKHRVNYDPYSNIGEQDITAHVNFSDLYKLGLENGFQCSGYTNQLSFLSALGLNRELYELEKNHLHKFSNPVTMQRFLGSFLTEMGHAIKVMILQKAISSKCLTGMQFALAK